MAGRDTKKTALGNKSQVRWRKETESLRGEDRRRRRAGGQTDKGKRHGGVEEKKRNRQKMSNAGGDNVNDGVRGECYGTDPRQHMNSGSSNMSREAANEEPALRQHMASS